LDSTDLVVTLCGDVADKCQATPPKVNGEFDDIAKATDTEEEKWAVFQQVLDEIGD